MPKSDEISVQISLYPLGDEDVTYRIFQVLDVIGSYDLDYQLGSMSTVVSGPTGTVFKALEEAYRTAASEFTVVLVCTMSNGAPTENEMESLKQR